MDLSAVGGSSLTPEIQAQYAVKCIKMAQQTEQIAGQLLIDVAEISAEAMEKFLAERA